MSRSVSASQLRTLIAQRSELAVLDVREEGVSERKRLFYSSVAPVGRLGLLIDRLVPRRGTPIVLVDTHGEYTPRAAALLERWGYTDVAILEGGVLSSLMHTLPKNERYSYVFEGNSQVLDQILVSTNLQQTFPIDYDVVHVNSEFADQASDHDPQVAILDLRGRPRP